MVQNQFSQLYFDWKSAEEQVFIYFNSITKAEEGKNPLQSKVPTEEQFAVLDALKQSAAQALKVYQES